MSYSVVHTRARVLCVCVASPRNSMNKVEVKANINFTSHQLLHQVKKELSVVYLFIYYNDLRNRSFHTLFYTPRECELVKSYKSMETILCKFLQFLGNFVSAGLTMLAFQANLHFAM